MYAIIDLETTGGKYNQEGITEIAIYKFDGAEVVDQLISLVNPETPIQPFVEKLTGISDAMVRTAPKFHELAKRVVEITEGCVLVAHNAQFDYRILKLCYDRLGYTYERKTVCTVDLAKKLIPDQESYSLGKLVKSLCTCKSWVLPGIRSPFYQAVSDSDLKVDASYFWATRKTPFQLKLLIECNQKVSSENQQAEFVELPAM